MQKKQKKNKEQTNWFCTRALQFQAKKSFSRPYALCSFLLQCISLFLNPVLNPVPCDRPLRTGKFDLLKLAFLRSASGQNQSQKSVLLHTRKSSSPDIYICKRNHLSHAGAECMSHVYRAPWVQRKKGKM